jgi:hypothetical protein
LTKITWDIHGSKPFTTIEGMKNIVAPMYDQAYAALIEDLGQRGMLDDTLVCGLAEFGERRKSIRRAGETTGRNVFLARSPAAVSAAAERSGASDPKSAVCPPIVPTTPGRKFANRMTIFQSLGLHLDPVLHTELPGPAGRPLPAGRFRRQRCSICNLAQSSRSSSDESVVRIDAMQAIAVGDGSQPAAGQADRCPAAQRRIASGYPVTRLSGFVAMDR